ncbi:uncharacterized protein LOC124814443 isoform X2 [Hydra vulgaris]|uniref:Uncharacterized protein LOC124814443 isoform X2 n=1 Tax=Hydra vulgaris TaxID=6087 RepID=A0ABM4C468_HYDVU
MTIESGSTRDSTHDSTHDSNNFSKPSLLIASSQPVRKISRDSLSSENSNSSGCERKPASFTQIQDLYSALHDLVKSNVRSNVIDGSDNTSSIPIIVMETNVTSETSFQESLSKIEENNYVISLNPSLKDIKNQESLNIIYPENTNSQSKSLHKRGYSLGTLGDLNEKKLTKSQSKSPLLQRKLSHGILRREKPIFRTSSKSKQNKYTEVSSITECSKKESRRNWNFKWRFRSKSSLSDPDQDHCSHDLNRDQNENDQTFQPKDIRRFSDGSISDFLPDFKSEKMTSKKFRRKQSLDVCNLRSVELEKIDNLITSLSSTKEVEVNITDTPNFYKSPSEELNKLESWFEMAAAEALKHSDNDELNNFGLKRKISSHSSSSNQSLQFDTKNENLKVGSYLGIVRSTPNLSTGSKTTNVFTADSKSQDEENELFTNIKFSASNGNLVSSTPNNNFLTSTPQSSLIADTSNNNLLTNFPNSKIIAVTPRRKVIRSQITFEEESLHFPKSPLFYVPYENSKSVNHQKEYPKNNENNFQFSRITDSESDDNHFHKIQSNTNKDKLTNSSLDLNL